MTRTMKTTRMEKARRIVGTPGRVRDLGGGMYAVGGDTQRVYLVDFHRSVCDCRDFEIHGRDLSCKHLLAVEIYTRDLRLAGGALGGVSPVRSRSVRKPAETSGVFAGKEGRVRMPDETESLGSRREQARREQEKRFSQGRRLLEMFESDAGRRLIEGMVG